MLSVLDNRLKEFLLYGVRLNVRLRTLLRKVRKNKNLLFCVFWFLQKVLLEVSFITEYLWVRVKFNHS